MVLTIANYDIDKFQEKIVLNNWQDLTCFSMDKYYNDKHGQISTKVSEIGFVLALPLHYNGKHYSGKHGQISTKVSDIGFVLALLLHYNGKHGELTL